jgi:DNA replication protein DnaC
VNSNNIGSQIATWRARIPATVDPADDDALQAADRAEMAAMRARQQANRSIAYQRDLPSKYANAKYQGLRSDQDPNGMISAWLDRGPRALLIAGPARTGKTTAAYAITNDAHDAGQWVVTHTAAGLSAVLKPDMEPLAFDHAAMCELLLIDDLGRERVTDWWLEQLQRVVDIRCSNNRRLIVTTNTAASPGEAYQQDEAYRQLVERYGDPVVERLIDDGGVIVLDGPAVRRVVTSW